MAIKNEVVVDNTSKYIVKSTGGKGPQLDEIIVDAEKLTEGTNGSKVSLIECYYLIEGTGTLSIVGDKSTGILKLTGKGKYGLRPNQLKFGNDKIFKLAVTPEVESYLLVTEFRRN